MRDILVCKNCEHFKENYLFPQVSYIVGTCTDVETFADSPFESFSSLPFKPRKAWRRRHNCMIDCMSVKYGLVSSDVEYYMLDVPQDCPFRMEHEMFEMNGEHGTVRYGIMPYFHMTRTCQHCGATMPNRKRCQRCGYDRFRTWKVAMPRDLPMSLMVAVAVVLILMTAFFCI